MSFALVTFGRGSIECLYRYSKYMYDFVGNTSNTNAKHLRKPT
jgi:hypothetical protein